MNTHEQVHPEGDRRRNEPRSLLPGRVVLVGFLGIAAVFLWTEHRAHVLGALPYLLVLLCPLLHLLHGGHGGHGGSHRKEGRDAPEDDERRSDR